VRAPGRGCRVAPPAAQRRQGGLSGATSDPRPWRHRSAARCRGTPRLAARMKTAVHAGEALDRLHLFFVDRPTRQGLLAREALGTPAPGDEELRERLVAGLRGDTRLDGSVGGAALPTVWRAHELL